MKHLYTVATLLAFGFSWAGSASDYLGSLSETDRSNAEVSLEVLGDRSQAEKAEQLWNSGKFEEALSLIESMEGDGLVGVGISWYEPQWGTDSKITPAGLEAESVELIEGSNGNLFVLVRGTQGEDTLWTLNMSSDGGHTWAETFRWEMANSYEIYDVDATERPGYVYVLYSTSFTPKMFLRRFRVSDGSYDAGFGYRVVDSSTSDFTDVSLELNTIYGEEFYAAGINGGHISFLYTADTGYTWSDLSPSVSNASEGLDMDYGWMSGSQHLLWMSWITSSAEVSAAGVTAGGWEIHNNLDDAYDFPEGVSSVAQRGDTILVAFNHQESDGTVVVRYQITYDDGGTWNFGYPAGQDDSSNQASVTARGGEGWQMAYVEYHYGSEPEDIAYTHRSYRGPGAWDAPQRLSEHDSWRWFKPSIEFLPSLGQYGVAYIDDSGVAWFNADGWSEVAEGARPQPLQLKAMTRPGGALIQFALPSDGFASLKLYEARGRLVKDLSGNFKAGDNRVSVDLRRAGTYFVLLRAEGQSAKSKLLIAR